MAVGTAITALVYWLIKINPHLRLAGVVVTAYMAIITVGALSKAKLGFVAQLGPNVVGLLAEAERVTFDEGPLMHLVCISLVSGLVLIDFVLRFDDVFREFVRTVFGLTKPQFVDVVLCSVGVAATILFWFRVENETYVFFSLIFCLLMLGFCIFKSFGSR